MQKLLFILMLFTFVQVSKAQFSVSSGTTVAVANANDLCIQGDINNNGTITNFTINGTNALNITGTGTINNVIVNKASGTATCISGMQSITGTYTPTAGVLEAGGFVTLKSDATGTARIAQGSTSGGYITGNVMVERYIPAGKRGFRFLSPSVTTTNYIKGNWQEGQNNTSTSSNSNTVAGYGTHITGSATGLNGFDATLTGNPSLYEFNNSTQAWSSGIANTNATNLVAGNAYRILVRGSRAIDLTAAVTPTADATTLRATGALLTGNVTFANTGSTPSTLPSLATNASDYSFIGNPYASPIDWSTVSKTELTGFYYIWDPTLATRGAYVSCNTSGVRNNASSAVTTAIQPGQAFFVQNSSNTASRQLVIAETDKTTGNTNVFRTLTGTSILGINLFLTNSLSNNGTSQDGATVLFNSSYSNMVNEDDAGKFVNQDENIAIQRASSLMSIESRNVPATPRDTVQLKIWQMAQNNYTLRLNASNFATNMNAYLQDSYLNTETLINLNGITDYNFATTANNAATNAANRFTIVFRSNSSLPVNILNVSASQKNAGIEINWNTASETNMDSYEVEESSNATTFTKATTVAAKNGATNAYTWFDAAVNNGDNYYRIKAIEKNGTVKYSNVVKVKIGSKAADFTVYPNPVKEGIVSLQMSNVEKGIYTVKIYNNIGQEVASKTINHAGGSATQTIDLSKAIATGNYNMQITNGTTVITKTVIVD